MSVLESLLREHIRGSREAIAEAVRRVNALEALTGKIAEAPSLPKERKNGWSKEDEETLRRNYPEGGVPACIKLIKRSPNAIRTHARRLGLVTSPASQRFWCDQCQFKVTRNQVAGCKSKFCEGRKLVARGDA